ncbi:holin [Bacillus sp. 7894-2]|uniref:holin n=1 Tax=Bacillus sp. 7894-2 TaxID=2021695 RepID=UPI000BA6CF13|nr:holin [Bacillus sp. 7894-2]PAE24085.1 hypothetical protein CHI10_14885 [Bacillus sp. 7894-2]
MKIKWQNYGLWTALGALATLVLNDAFGIAPEQTNLYVNALLLTLVAAGIVSNPEKGKWFPDENGNGIDDRLEGGNE